jgi:hypothetical protein
VLTPARRRRGVGLEAGTRRRGGLGLRAARGHARRGRLDEAHLGLDAAALTAGAASGQIGLVGASARLVGARGGAPKVLDFRPPSAAPRL